MKAFIITVLALSATCALAQEKCDISFYDSGSTTLIEGMRFIDVLEHEDSKWTAVIENGQYDILYKTGYPMGGNVEKLTDLDAEHVKAKLERAYESINSLVGAKNIAGFMFIKGELYDKSKGNINWTVSTRNGQYLVQSDGKQKILFNVQGSPAFKHIIKHNNGLLTVVKDDCSVMTLTEVEQDYDSVYNTLEEEISQEGWLEVGDLPTPPEE